MAPIRDGRRRILILTTATRAKAVRRNPLVSVCVLREQTPFPAVAASRGPAGWT